MRALFLSLQRPAGRSTASSCASAAARCTRPEARSPSTKDASAESSGSLPASSAAAASSTSTTSRNTSTGYTSSERRCVKLLQLLLYQKKEGEKKKESDYRWACTRRSFCLLLYNARMIVRLVESMTFVDWNWVASFRPLQFLTKNLYLHFDDIYYFFVTVIVRTPNVRYFSVYTYYKVRYICK